MQWNLSTISALDRPGVDLATEWTTVHDRALQACVDRIINGDWLAIYDPSKVIYAYTDAATGNGYGVAAYQVDDDGKPRHLLVASHGWTPNQAKWRAQVQEAFAQKEAVIKYLYKYFPYSKIHLFCDNRNLSAGSASADPRVERYQYELDSSGLLITRQWIPGDWNAIADHVSRIATISGANTPEADAEARIYAITGNVAVVSDARNAHVAAITARRSARVAGLPPTLQQTATPVVNGHVFVPELVKRIALAQQSASDEEKASWPTTSRLSYVAHSHTLECWHGRYIIPSTAKDIKDELLTLAHDAHGHLPGAERTLIHLQRHAQVWWTNMERDVIKYVKSCVQCQFAKARHEPSKTGSSTPTASPYPFHTLYIDHAVMWTGEGSPGGHILVIIDSFTRMTALRYVNNLTASDVTEELDEAILSSFHTYPVTIRCDSAAVFQSDHFTAYCRANGIVCQAGPPYAQHAQGIVEKRMEYLKVALKALLGGRAPHDWNYKDSIARLEFLLNTTYCDSIKGSPYWALTGIEPRTPLTAATTVCPIYVTPGGNAASIDVDLLNNCIAEHHARVNAIRVLTALSSSNTQLKRAARLTAERASPNIKEGDTVGVHQTPLNGLLPYLKGPYVVTKVDATGDYVELKGWIDASMTLGPTHVSRVRPMDLSRATPSNVAAYLATPGVAIIEAINEHRDANGAREFLVKWVNFSVPTWTAASNIPSDNAIFVKYCSDNGLPAVGATSLRAATRRARGTRGGTR